jgi:hypothetical protein
VRIERGDDGLDVYVGELTDPAGIAVFQCKFFPLGVGESQKGQIRDSFKRCRNSTSFKTKKWTLCLPVDLSVEEKRWFEEWRAKQADSGIVIEDPWGALKLEGLLYQPGFPRWLCRFGMTFAPFPRKTQRFQRLPTETAEEPNG